MINKFLEKVKHWLKENSKDLYIAAIIFLVGLISFGLGRLSVLVPKKEPIQIKEPDQEGSNVSKSSNSAIETSTAGAVLSQGKYVASKNSKVYHFPWCSGAQRIKEENKIWFQTKEEAEKLGYKPAGNCEGL